MDKVLQMLLAGMSETEIRQELSEYLSTQKQSGGLGERGAKTYRMAIGILASWFAPDKQLLSFREEALALARQVSPELWLPLHWSIISASYPFWFNVALQTGRLLNLQEQITQAQIFKRMKEQYGDRETVARNARYTIRSFVAWGVLKDSAVKGCYEKSTQVNIRDQNFVTLLLEAALHTTLEGKGTLSLLLSNPALFPFQIPVVSGHYISQHSKRVEVIRYGLDDELLKLKIKT
ncbi:MAG: hypothetical protein HQM12_17225 [SAR324 cluster bacterium]|nr:hypothetical protein [SAR324 cluster bacterium]